MFKSRSFLVGLLAIILLPSALGCTVASVSAGSTVPVSQTPSQAHAPAAVELNLVSSLCQAASGPAVTSRAASRATAVFMTQNGQAVGDVPSQASDVPHLVLYRNGALTAPDERTLRVEVTGFEVPATGVTVTLQVETQHGDPDLGGSPDSRIPVWRASQWIAKPSGTARVGDRATFSLEFGETAMSGAEAVATPTDYFRYDVVITDGDHPATHPLYAFGADYGFLMENQWIAPLPEVQETSPGAAPDELVVYYCDMFPFQRDGEDPTTRMLRAEIPSYVRGELVPRMVEAFRVETDDWGFPWHDRWTSYRSEGPQGTERLSVALSDGQTWFHGRAPDKGHAGISIRVTGGPNVWYDTLTDGIMNTFYHELFHSLQRNINQMSGGNGDIDGAKDGSQFISEGTADLASAVGQPAVQFAQSLRPRAYVFDANSYMGGDGYVGELNTSYARLRPYYAAIYFRFLYERCGGMQDGVEDPAAGMRVIKRTLAALYSRDVGNIRSSGDLVVALPRVMDQALEGSACPFRTYEESLVEFARTVYALRLDGGRCAEPGVPAGCGFYDPNDLYRNPRMDTIAYVGTAITYAAADQLFPAGIRSSFGVDLVDVVLDPAANGQPLTIEFYGAPAADAVFHVQLWKLIDPGGGARPRRIPSQVAAPEVLAPTNADGHLVYAIPAVDTAAYNRLGLIITRIDAHEGSDPIGEYTIVLRAEVG
jgi:hypothetical protein